MHGGSFFLTTFERTMLKPLRSSETHSTDLPRHLFGALLLLAVALFAPHAAASDDVPSTEPASSSAAKSAHHGSVFIDPLGFLLFGPTLGVEFGSNKISATLYGRWLDAGVASRSLFLGAGEQFDFSYGVGLRGRYYLHGNGAGPHLGVAAEVLRSRVEAPLSLIVTTSKYVTPMAEAGYRFDLGGAYLGLTGAVGYAFQTSSSIENLPGGLNADRYETTDRSNIYGSANLDLGMYF